MLVYPLKFKPIFKERIWGGQKLQTFFNKDIPKDKNIGESWELVDLPDDKSEIINGPLAGQTLTAAIEKLGTTITGNSNYKPPFPLFIKILDAQDSLSVQVHPDQAACKRMGQGYPKTECWYIIEAEPNAAVYKGLKPNTTKKQFAEAIESGTCGDLLEKIHVEVGQCHFLPAGTPHAIGAGLLIAEIQTPSDTTYRVFDWNRTDDSGKPRQLHIPEALESIHFDPSADNLTVKTVGRLADADEFKIDKGHQTQTGEVLLKKDQMKVLIILTGSGQINTTNAETTPFKKGEHLLIPADCQGVMTFAEDTSYLTVTI